MRRFAIEQGKVPGTFAEGLKRKAEDVICKQLSVIVDGAVTGYRVPVTR